MGTIRNVLSGLLAVGLFAAQAQAYTETVPPRRSSFLATGSLVESTSFSVTVVKQGVGGLTILGFESVTNAFNDSGEALEVTVNTNLAGNRVIVYTNNLNAAAVPKACFDTGNTNPLNGPVGNDGGGLVGLSDCKQTVPVLWAINDTNVDHSFTTGTIGDDEIYVTDKAHVLTFDPLGSGGALDNKAMVRCDTKAAVTNASNDGLYPQFFGRAGVNDDLCDAAPPQTVVVAQELSKNIAVASHSFFGTAGTAPKLSTPDPADSIPVTSPIYLAIGADFRFAAPQTYSTSTLTVELITQ